VASEEYRQLLRDPRWQRMRLKVMERDGFACKACLAEDKTLNVHHKFYRRGAKPWEYDESSLITSARIVMHG
jgi:5-methylcytosine-specific restriction endonuclease McrA